MSTDRELLKWAAKAVNGGAWHPLTHEKPWNPLTDDGDALRLAVKLGIDLSFEGDNVVFADGNCSEFLREDYCAATRRAIVRAAAAIGKAMP